MTQCETPRVVIVHDYLTQRGGAERVVLAMARAFPGAPIYTSFYNPETTYPEFKKLDVRPSWANKIGYLRREPRRAFLLLPMLVSLRQIDCRLALISSSGWAHGSQVRGHSIVYCYSPARWLYQAGAYLGNEAHVFMRLIVKVIGPVMRLWDRRAAARSDKYLAISSVVRDRIKHTYQIGADLLPAPVTFRADIPREQVPGLEDWAGYFLCVSRLLPYKNVLEVVDAFKRRPEKLVLVGDGPLWDTLMARRTPNIRMFKALTDAQLATIYERSRAVIAASFEDFGLTPLEGGLFGKPALALRWGGFLDTVEEHVTGEYFEAPEPWAINEALAKFGDTKWDAEVIRRWASNFSEERFARALNGYVDATLDGT